MNKIEAIIRPEMLNPVKDALAEAGMVGINVVNVTGRGVQRGVVTAGGPRGTTQRYVVDMLPKVKLEMVVSDSNTERAIDIIINNARTGNIGDGKIFVTHVTDAIRVRTGERGDGVL
jgi:nitrogen regulatory protein P-II 1